MPRIFKVGVGDAKTRASNLRSQERGLFIGNRTNASVNRIGADDSASELAPCPGIFETQATAGQEARLIRSFETLTDTVKSIRPRGRNQCAVFANQRGGQAILLVPLESEAILVGDPLFVDLRIVAGHTTDNLTATDIDAERRTGSIMLGNRRGRHEVERAGAEAVRGSGQCANRANLNDVAREVGRELATGLIKISFGQVTGVCRTNDACITVGTGDSGITQILRLRVVEVQSSRVERADLFCHEVVVIGRSRTTTATLQINEHVAGDFLTEAHTTLAENATIAVEQDLAGQTQRLAVGALRIGETGLCATIGHCLVLQGALATLIADRAVQRVVDQQELHHAMLCLLGNLGCELSLDDHSGSDGLCT